MSKDILSLKFRPQTFDEFIGQPQVVYPLVNSIKNGNIHHAYLFFGPRGVGKTSAARILAKMLNCEHGPTATPCNKCTNCIEITNNISPDVIEIDGASNRGINEIRQLQENIKFAPLKSRYKIYIIDEVHMLTKEAFNALLKTLEEPPEHVIFIFATTEIYKVLPTIRSRCQQYQFKLFTIKEIKQLLIKILSYYKINYEERALYWIAKFANGSLRDSLSILSQIIAYNNNKLTEKDTLYILGVQPITNLINLFNTIIKKDITSLYKIINDTSISGIDAGNFAQQIVDFLRILSFINNNLTEYEILEMSKDDFEKIKDIASHFNTKQIIFMIEKLAEFIKNMNIYLNPFPYLENILISFAFYEDFIYPSEIIQEIKKVKSALEKKYVKVYKNENENISSQENKTNNINNINEFNKIKDETKINKKIEEIETTNTKTQNTNLYESNDNDSKKNDNVQEQNKFEISEELKQTLKFDETTLFDKSNKNDNNSNLINNGKENIKQEPSNNTIKQNYQMDNKSETKIANRLNNLKSIAKENIKNSKNIPESYKPLMEIFDSTYIEEKE